MDRYSSEDGKRKGVRLRNKPEDITGGYISGLMQELEDALIAEDGYHPKTRKHYTDYIDLESWADKYLVEEISRSNGGGTSSYFYKQPDHISTKIFGGPVWDCDKGFGRLCKVNANTRDLALLTLYNGYTSWFYYIYQKEEFVDMVKKQYKNKFSDYLGEMADNLVRLPLAKAAMILVVNGDAGKEQTASVMELVKKYSRYHKVKSRNISDGQLDMVIELWVAEEEELVEKIAGLSKIHAVSLMSHDGEVTF